MIIGVLRQLGPVAFGLKLPSPNLISVALSIWIPALIAMIVGFATLHYEVAGVATSILFVAILVVVTVFAPAFRGVRRETPHYHMMAALPYFGTAAFLGTWMAVSKGFDLALPASFQRVLFTHIHLAGAGWAGMMILAVLSRLFPQPHLRKPFGARLRFAGFHVGLIGLSAGLLAGAEWYPIFGAALAASCIAYALAFIPVLIEFGQPSDRSTAFLVASWVWLVAVALMGIWLCFVPSVPSAFSTQLQFVYGFLYLFGWLTFMILGMLYRIVPTHVSKLLTARGATATVAMRRAFINPRIQMIVLIALSVGLAISSVGILRQNVVLFRFGWSLWLAGIVGFVGGFIRLGVEVRNILSMAQPN